MEDQQKESVMSEVSRERSKREVVVEELKPYIYSIFCSVCFAGYNIISKICLNEGMSQYVLVVYGQIIGTLTTAILAFLFERKNKSELSLPIVRDIFFLGLLGTGIGTTFYFTGLQYTSPELSTALTNLIPSMTFILAVLCRMEKLEIFRRSTQAKIVGSLVAFGGAVLMTLYKGIVVVSFHSNSHQSGNRKVYSHGENWIKGSIFLLIAYFSSTVFYVLQSSTIKKYPAPIALTSYTCLSGTIFSTIIAAFLDRKASSWRLSWNIALLGPVYGGVIIFGITYYLQTLVTSKRGPVFMTAFKPLATVIAAVMGLFILGDALQLGGILGATLIFIGLYAILWGKKEEEEKEYEKKILELTRIDQSIEMKFDQAIEIKYEK